MKNPFSKLINRGEIVAKTICLDTDLYEAEKKDFKNLPRIEKAVAKIRAARLRGQNSRNSLLSQYKNYSSSVSEKF